MSPNWKSRSDPIVGIYIQLIGWVGCESELHFGFISQVNWRICTIKTKFYLDKIKLTEWPTTSATEAKIKFCQHVSIEERVILHASKMTRMAQKYY